MALTFSLFWSLRKDAKGGDKKGGKKDPQYEPAAPPTFTSIYPEGFRMAENICHKDRQKLDKILANIEYAEAHGADDEAKKLRQKLTEVNQQARAKAAHKAERDAEIAAAKGGTHTTDSTKVVHGGRKVHPKVEA